MKNMFKKGILVLLLGLSLIYGLSLDGIDIIDILILAPIALISLFYFITPLFLSLKQIEAVDNWFDDILEFDFSKGSK
ncbi:hypothetical protein FITA111629_01480 [Filibacter tadaridae]|uniref:Uncharacterized protein n=1 Tax=Filibacter tadaridae TaxID=2483811 RepID=A0A3P5XP06_9BACL|nr:hypothetical protein [Filibacter tadaridae]VDC29551.1 hypothetical protein FILTAD_02143 [Filibacter tadaridae]